MKRLLLISLLVATRGPAHADTATLEQRVAALEREVAALKVENQKLKESSVDFLAAELAKKETDRARGVYRTQVLPLVERLASDLGATPRKLPREEEIQTMLDAYRPFIELIAETNKAIGSN